LKPERKRRIAAAQQEQKNTRLLFKGAFFLVRLGPEFLDIGQDFTLFAKLNYYGRNCSTCSRGYKSRPHPNHPRANPGANNACDPRDNSPRFGFRNAADPDPSTRAEKNKYDVNCGACTSSLGTSGSWSILFLELKGNRRGFYSYPNPDSYQRTHNTSADNRNRNSDGLTYGDNQPHGFTNGYGKSHAFSLSQRGQEAEIKEAELNLSFPSCQMASVTKGMKG